MRIDQPTDIPPFRTGELTVPFLFVPEGQSTSEDWLQAHPGAIRVPATAVFRQDGSLTGVTLAQNEGDAVSAATLSALVNMFADPSRTGHNRPSDSIQTASRTISAESRQSAPEHHYHAPIDDATRKENSPVPLPDREDPLAPVPFRDGNGQQVFAPDGTKMMRPQGMDPHFFVNRGIEDKEREYEILAQDSILGWVDAFLYMESELSKFDRGNIWDAQRIGHAYRPEFVDYATVLIGLYAAASGIPESLILLIENIIAFKNKYEKGENYDNVYRYLPERNVKNTGEGYYLYNSRKISPDKK